MTQKSLQTTELRIGVFICYCGLNIGAVVDVADVADYARSLQDVVYVKTNRYTCADPGQEEIRKGIREYNLNRVVVAACSPRMHEPTFRRTVSEAGLNPFLFEMANIREFSSWCHPSTPEKATEKAKEIVKMAVAKVRLLQPLDVIEVPVTNKALVVGGGVSGTSAALALAEMGYKVYLVDRAESIGGHMAQLSKTFPLFECSNCPQQNRCARFSCVATRIGDVAKHPNIQLLTYSEVKEVEGVIGSYKVKVVKKPRFVDESKCVGYCNVCVEKCPVQVPNEFDAGTRVRKAIYMPFDQAVPLVHTIDKENCLYFKDGNCTECKDVCEVDAIDFEQKPEEITFEVGTIIVATGFDIYEPYELKHYGYGKYKNVVTGLQLERILDTGTQITGELVRPSDSKKPNSITFIQCVGSRDVEKFEYCSGFCCMLTLKNAVLLKEKYGDDLQVNVLYTDMRTNKKGYEELFSRAQDMGINFIRTKLTNRKVVEVPETESLTVQAETENNDPVETQADMVVLATAAIPSKGSEDIARTFNISRGANGFFMESHPKLKPLDTPVDGTFVAGACQGPKDVPYSVAQGSGAAARAATILSKPKWKIEPIVAVVDPEKCRNTKVKCGICAERCPYGAIEAPENQPAKVITAMCHGCGTCVAECPADAITQKHFTDDQIIAQIRTALEDNPESKILGFLCNWCCYAGADLAGTSRFEYPPLLRPIRVMCSGRVDRDFVLEAFSRGVGMVLVGACHLPYDCHYINGNERMKVRMDTLTPMLEKLGLSPQRFRVEYVSAAEGLKFAELMKEMAAQMKELGSDKIKAENAKLKPILDRMLARKQQRSQL
ncbi:hydrogenase iron-sulfur subunit [Candidatus Bathyarchaeota archaeon]|nr:hydrogenase iron-sulfur subunit [Candidatus Bathyarchaeota archaeon]